MNLKYFLLSLLTLIVSTVSYAADTDCILIQADGVETSYLVSQDPKIYYQIEDGVRVARVLLGDSTTPVITVQLVGDKTLKIMYPSATDVNAILMTLACTIAFACMYAQTIHVYQDGIYTKSYDSSQIWGEDWRMPTEKEFWELILNCSWTFTNQNGKDGFLVESQVKGYEGRSIFLPCTGYRDSYSLEGARTSCYYWTSTYNGSNPYCLRATNGGKPEVIEYYMSRGCAIRPVCP